MTAEIAVMNKMAIALAADSAVTGKNKIYNSVNKLFQYSDHRPVGIMIYGSAEFMGVPWESIIKVHRASIGDAKESTLADYGKRFIQYLVDQHKLFPEEQRAAYVVRSTKANLIEL